MLKEKSHLGEIERGVELINFRDSGIDLDVLSNRIKVKVLLALKDGDFDKGMWTSEERGLFESRGYVPHEKDNLKTVIREVKGLGRGVFAAENIQEGEVIAEFVGKKYEAEKETLLPEIMVDHVVQVGEYEYVHAYKRLAELVNHSCGVGANCGISNLTEIVAMREISMGEELRWDYRRTEDSDWVMDDCQCGSDDCTGVVGPFSDLPEEMQVKYLEDGFTSDWIQEKYKKNKRRQELEDGNYFEVKNLKELSENEINEISDYFRYAFNNAFPEYAVCTDCEVALSAPEVFGTGREYVSLAVIDDECNLPDCEKCGEKMKKFIDPEVTKNNLEKKFDRDGKILLLRSGETDEICGMTFGYYESLENAVEMEWGHPYNYMKKDSQDEDSKFDVGRALDIINKTDGVSSTDEVFCWNCIVIDPDVRSNFDNIVGGMANCLLDSGRVELPVIAQVLSSGLVKRWMLKFYHEIDEVFAKQYSFLLGDLKGVCNNYLTKL